VTIVRTQLERIAAASAAVTAATFAYQKAVAEWEQIKTVHDEARAPFIEPLKQATEAVSEAKRALDIALRLLEAS
jgi:hypothetical protein